MKQEKPMCWCCVWRDITGPDNDPTLGCGHTSAQIRRRFEGSSTAEYCKEYLEDDPELKLKIDRITRETLMKNIHQLVVTDGHYAAAEVIVTTSTRNGTILRRRSTAMTFISLPR